MHILISLLVVAMCCKGFCVEVDQDRFLKKTDQLLREMEEFKATFDDPASSYAYSWALGKQAGIIEARRIFEQCHVEDAINSVIIMTPAAPSPPFAAAALYVAPPPPPAPYTNPFPPGDDCAGDEAPSLPPLPP